MARGQRFITARRLLRVGLAASLLVLATGLSAISAYAAAPVPSVQFRLPYVGGQQWVDAHGWGTTSHTGALNYYAYDFDPPATHLPILAAADGTVVDVTTPVGAKCSTSANDAGLANTVRIKHADATYSDYVHLTSVFVSEGQVVKQGQIIGTSGCTGYTLTSSGGIFEHLHFARVWYDSSLTTTNKYRSMPTSFQDVSASGTLASPTMLKTGSTYTSLDPCGQDASIAVGNVNAVPTGRFCARYYRDKTLDNPGTTTKARYWSAMSRIDSSIGFSWGTSGFPEDSRYDPYFTASTFSARWVGRFILSSGTWRFDLKASDGIRLYIDNMTTPVYASWTDRSTTLITSISRSLSSGSHVIKVEYYNAGTGSAEVSVSFNCTSGIC